MEFLWTPWRQQQQKRESWSLLCSSLSLLKISLFCTNTCTVECCVVDLWQSGGSEERHPFFPASYFVPQQQKKESKEERQRENESRGRRKKRQLVRRKLYRLDFLLDRRWRCTDSGGCVLFVIECGEEKIPVFPQITTQTHTTERYTTVLM